MHCCQTIILTTRVSQCTQPQRITNGGRLKWFPGHRKELRGEIWRKIISARKLNIILKLTASRRVKQHALHNGECFCRIFVGYHVTCGFNVGRNVVLGKGVWALLAFIFFILGIVAIFLPFSPSVVFFAIAAFCLINVSEKFKTYFSRYPILSALIASIERSRTEDWRDRPKYLWRAAKNIIKKNA